MPQRGHHYERAFEALLQDRGIPYVRVDQARKALISGAQLKSFDFILYPPERPAVLVDVKGRRLPRAAFEKGRLDQGWTTAADIAGLAQWEAVFGADHRALLLFAFWIVSAPDDLPWPFEDTEHFDGRDYHFVVIDLDVYRRAMTTRSPRWQTVHVAPRRFRRLVTPLRDFLGV